MGLAAVDAAVTARLAALWTRCPVRTINGTDGDVPKKPAAFLSVEYPVMRSAQISFGSPGANVYRDDGAIRFVLSAVAGKGIKDPLVWIDELAALVRGKTFGGVKTFAPSPPVIDDQNDNGGYFLLTFAVPFEHDYLG
ncbi:hypothetical protein R1A27_20175 [Methylobacterium sp. NMS12]|uniref:hypothetical protein n=1 Tax=Methylobacterium sp. NMS12 TaxID=3079766 RepID=UPI003F881EA5